MAKSTQSDVKRAMHKRKEGTLKSGRKREDRQKQEASDCHRSVRCRRQRQEGAGEEGLIARCAVDGPFQERAAHSAGGMDTNSDCLLHGPLGVGCAHLCVDMQRIFDEETPWKTPWLRRVLPNVVEKASAKPRRAVSFPLIDRAKVAERGNNITSGRPILRSERIGREMVDLVPELAIFAPPAPIVEQRAVFAVARAEAARLAARQGGCWSFFYSSSPVRDQNVWLRVRLPSNSMARGMGGHALVRAFAAIG